MKLPHVDQDELHFRRIVEDGVQTAARRGTAVVEKMTRTLVARSSNTCKAGNNSSECAKPESETTTMTLPIVLGAVIPITCAIVVFIYLHRRNKKKQALEDANDPHKSLDFGVGYGGSSSKNKKGGGKGNVPEMTITDMGGNPIRPGRGPRGLSMDMMGSPYLLPAGLQGSRESLHSMSRSVQDEHDPYRPVAFIRGSSETTRSPRPFNENGSMYSASTAHTGNEKSNLLVNAQRMSQSYPKRGDSISPSDSSPPEDFATRDLHSSNRSVAPGRKGSSNSSTPTLPNISESSPTRKDSRKDSPPPLPPLPPDAHEPAEEMPPPRTSSASLAPRPPRKSSMHASTHPEIDSRQSTTSIYEDDIPPPPLPPKWTEPEVTYYEDTEPGVAYYEDTPDLYAGRFSIDTPAPSQQYPVQNNRMSAMGLRPLPPAVPEDNPEQRANRIRSFYKEYFDDSRPNPQRMFYEDWDPNSLDAAIYDPETGDYVYPEAPFAQPMGRRAMTPPPRGAPQFPGGPAHGRHYSTQSAGRGPVRGRPGQRPPPKKNLPPPKALTSLPTPHKLQGENYIFNAIDFAPPTSFREVQNGRRPDSPLGIQRPFSPAVRAHSPLVASFDDLAVLPSPHQLRKSGTFTTLDFAPPRFRGQESATMSDAGSIRSARSGISAMQIDAVRSGAYRVSRIPKEMVTTREDLSQQLRPKMDLISRA